MFVQKPRYPLQSPASEAKIEAMFDRVAPRYDLLNRLLSMRQDQRWRRRLISMIPFRPNGCYLDVATGTGDVLLAARQIRREYGEFVGVDISSEMLRRAALKAKSKSSPLTTFKKMSAEALDVQDSTIDCLSISFGLRNVIDRAAALKEFHRVLRPDGVLLILEFFLPEGGIMGRAFQFYFHRFLPVIGGLLSDKEAYKYLPESVGSFYKPGELRTALYDTGFSVTESVSYLFGACRLIKAIKL
jgi:demethylmenaquinone methyltransferase/2-methoxy-6-polyprenyl-1,4-benzoquinol methylase